MFSTSPQRKLILSRKRCRPLIEKIQEEFKFEIVKSCNVCGHNTKTILSVMDRYGIPIRTAMCNNCGLVYLVDRPDKNSYQIFYQKYYRPLISKYWGHKIDNDHIVHHQDGFTRKLLASLYGVVSFKEINTLLDIGGSTGMIAHALAEKYHLKATVLDPSADELAVAESKGLDTIHGFIEDYEPNRSFDIILFLQTIDHVFDLRKTLERIALMLNDGGVFVVDTVNLPLVNEDQTYLGSFFKIDHCYYFTNDYMMGLLRVFGFKILNMDIASWPGHTMFVCQKTKEFVADKIEMDINRLRNHFIQNIEHDYYHQSSWKDNAIRTLARLKRRWIK